MAKIVTMGEIMLRLSTPGNEKFIQADEFDINYGGSEANVAVSLANYGYDTEYVSAIPDNPIGDCAWQRCTKYNVGTKYISEALETVWAFIIWSRGLPCVRQTSRTPTTAAGSSIACATADLFGTMPFSQMRTGFPLQYHPAFSDSARSPRRQR